ncbi:MAG: CoA pyrophosphatase [Bacteroidales bacterium]|nr:CoA pyrophosphatase [Bacteroidales bacterium]
MCFISEIKLAIKGKLPGISAQQKMAPSIRNIEALLNKSKPPLRNSAVLILLFFDKEWKVVLTKRHEYIGPHSNQVSFPGGKQEPTDKNLVETAIRETFEEIGIKSENVEVLGLLSPLFIPVSNNMVQPVVGFYKEKPVFIPSEFEVKEIIEVGIQHLTNHKTRKTETIKIEDRTIDAPYFEIGNHHVWGATAMILSEFCELVNSINQ